MVQPRDTLRSSGLAQVVALASVLLAGCGGDSASGEPAPESGEGSGAPQQNAGDVTSGIEPAAPNPALPLEGAIAAPRDPTLEAAPLEPQPTVVELTSDTVQVGAGEGLLSSPLFIARSPLGTRLELVEANERICVRGELAAVPNGDYPNYWGGEVGVVLGSSPTTDVAAPGEGLQTPGFAFRLEGTVPLQLRLRVGAAGEVPVDSQYCQPVPTNTGANIEITLQALTFECWLADGAPFPGDASATLVSWQIPANEETASAFDFCIEDIRALP